MGLFIVWLILSFIVGGMGSERKIGFWGAFFLSLLLSPLIGFIVVLTSKTLRQENLEKHLLKTQTEQIKTLHQMQQTENIKQRENITEELEKLAKMKADGLITTEDFEKAKSKILG